MEKATVIKAVKAAKEKARKRNFVQTFDLIINLKGLDLKKAEHQVDLFVDLHHKRGKPSKICAFVGPELKEQATQVCNKIITVDDFPAYKDKKVVKKLAEDFDFFVAQGNIMAQVASMFGKVLGPRKKMPNPKAGCVVPPNANLKPLVEKLQRLVRLTAKTQKMIQIVVGNEDMPDEEVADNIVTSFNTLIQNLPSEAGNVKNLALKLTMGKAIKLSDKGEIKASKEENKAEEKPKEAKPKAPKEEK